MSDIGEMAEIGIGFRKENGMEMFTSKMSLLFFSPSLLGLIELYSYFIRCYIYDAHDSHLAK